MEHFIDISHNSVNKHGEELCGDKVEVFKNDDKSILVLADGLGSGVKANILATLTTKIAGTMLKEGAGLKETINTVMNTLPECQVRKLAYSTFCIVELSKNGKCRIIEYDNPPIIVLRKGQMLPLEKEERLFADKKVKSSEFYVQESDVIVSVSDGAIHAGIGGYLNLGWQWENVRDFVKEQVPKHKSAEILTNRLLEACNTLYDYRPGDDTTVATIKIRKPEVTNIFTGPPTNKDFDSFAVKRLMSNRGKRVVCGGTAAKIVARETGEEIHTELNYIDMEVPPIAHIKGMDLVTEGVLTLKKATEKIKGINSIDRDKQVSLDGEDGASRLAKLLVEDSTHINLIVGKAINPAHQNPDFPSDLSIKLKIVNQLVEALRNQGKVIETLYI